MMLTKLLKLVFLSEMYFHVPVSADLIRVLAHAFAGKTLLLLPYDADEITQVGFSK